MNDATPSARLNDISLALNVPVAVTVELTRRCPLKCLHCYLPETRGRSGPCPEISTAQWKKILRDLAEAGALYVVFTGGEPLLRPDLAELCAYAKSLKFDVRVYSTGLGLDKKAAAGFKAAGVSRFEISFYGRPAAHDSVTGVPGSFAQSLAASRLLLRAGVGVRMKMPLMRKNISQAGWLKALASAEGFDISFDPVITVSNDGNAVALKQRLSAPGLTEAVRLYGTGPHVSTGEAFDAASADLLCGAGRNVCAVSPAGDLYPCLQLQMNLGNLLRQKFSRIWKTSSWLKNWRSAGTRGMEKCRSCADLEFCSRCPGVSLQEEGDAFAPNKPACQMAHIMRSIEAKPR